MRLSCAKRLSINGNDVRPRGVDHFNYGADQADAAAMVTWRRAYQARPRVRQMMLATIIWLYRGGANKTWIGRLPSTWHAADAVAAPLEAGAHCATGGGSSRCIRGGDAMPKAKKPHDGVGLAGDLSKPRHRRS